jgi:serine/threonine protein kinase
LRDLLDRRGRLPWETMVDFAEAICEALAYAHDEGVVHRRLTPSRVLVTAEGGVKLVGFDSALGDSDDIVALKAPMSVMHYLAPQEIRGKRSVGLPSNDLFSLGVILYVGLAGELPWPARNPAALIQARQAAPAPRASAKVLDCPVWLDVLVARLLEVKREGRFASADDARRAILVAKEKATAGVGAVQQAWSGRQGALAPKVDKQELSRLRKAAAQRAPKETGPFYERVWFLAACLAAVFAAGAWAMWPLNEEQLYARAKPLMQSERADDWLRAQNEYVAKLLERYPDTQYSSEIAEFQFRLAVHQAEERIKNVDRFERDFQWEIDRQYYAARRDEQRGDRLAAWEKYDALVKLFAGSEKLQERAVVELARRRIEEIRRAARDGQGASELTTVVQQKLDLAAQLVEDDELLRAREVLQGIVELYDGNLEAAPLVDEARERIRRLSQRESPNGG